MRLGYLADVNVPAFADNIDWDLSLDGQRARLHDQGSERPAFLPNGTKRSVITLSRSGGVRSRPAA